VRALEKLNCDGVVHVLTVGLRERTIGFQRYDAICGVGKCSLRRHATMRIPAVLLAIAALAHSAAADGPLRGSRAHNGTSPSKLAFTVGKAKNGPGFTLNDCTYTCWDVAPTATRWAACTGADVAPAASLVGQFLQVRARL
jgi:hypothetical protein